MSQLCIGQLSKKGLLIEQPAITKLGNVTIIIIIIIVIFWTLLLLLAAFSNALEYALYIGLWRNGCNN